MLNVAGLCFSLGFLVFGGGGGSTRIANGLQLHAGLPWQKVTVFQTHQCSSNCFHMWQTRETAYGNQGITSIVFSVYIKGSEEI